jgi:hypothetical protein
MLAPFRPRHTRRARHRLAQRALAAVLLLALVLPPALLPAPQPAAAQATTPTPVPSTSTPSPTPWPTPFPGGGPPAADPAGPPSAYTLARADQLFVTRTQYWPDAQGQGLFGATYTFNSAVNGVNNATPFADTGLPAGDPSWPLLPVRGRFTDGLHEQALLLSQANDCAGPGACTFTYLLGQAAPGAAGVPVVPAWLRRVQGTGEGGPVAVSAGDLDGRVSAQGFGNDEVAVASRNPDGTLRVEVIDYNVVVGDAVDTAPFVALPAIGTSLAGPGSLGVGIGDFDADGRNEIAVLWQGGGCPASPTTPPCLSAPHLSMLRYTNDGRNRTLAVLQADVPLPAAMAAGSPAPQMGFQTAVDDFDGQGRDQLAVSYVEQGATLAVLGFVRGDPQFTVDRFGAVTDDFTGKVYCPAAGCSGGAGRLLPQLTSGLLWYDPAGGYELNRRQLAQAALQSWTSGSGGQLGLQVYDVRFDASTCVQNQPPCPLTVVNLLGQNGTVVATFEDSTGSAVIPSVSLAAGSFQGLILNPSSPSQVPWALAVGVSGLIGNNTQASASVSYYRVGAGIAPGLFPITQLFQSDQEQAATAPRVLAYDPAGASLALGAPLVFTFADHQVATYILQDPPKHMDWIPPQPTATPRPGLTATPGPTATLARGSWVNVDRSSTFTLDVTQDKTTAYTSQSTTGSDWTIGGSVTVNVTASTEEGLGPIANAGGGLDASASVGDQNDINSSSYNQGGSSHTLSVTGSTVDDDYLAGTQRSWTVYRYPILGRALRDTQGRPVLGPNGQPQYGFYEITLPGHTTAIPTGGGLAFGDWYQPVHQNGIALSYPQIDQSTGLVPVATPGAGVTPPSGAAVLGPGVTLVGSDDNGTKPLVVLPQPLVNTAYSVGNTGETVQLQISGTTGSGDSTNTNNTLSESADVDVGASGGLFLGVAEVSACADVDLKFNNSNSWSTLKTGSNSTTSTNTFTLTQDAAAQPNYGYAAATAYYTDPSGVYRVQHAVDMLYSTDAGPEWKTHYGGRPDPALNLPNRMVMTYNSSDGKTDIPNWNDSDSRQFIRGFFVLRPDAANGGGASGSLAAGAPFGYPTDGDTVQLQVRVHNYSLDTPALAVPVEFWAIPRDAHDENDTGSPFQLGAVTLDSIPPLGWVPANFLWGTAGMAPTGAQNYRIFVIVARNDAKNPNDPWNNVIHAWADRYDDPATVDGTPSTARLIEPFTGQPEVLEAGQYKQGRFLVTINSKPAAPAPLAAARPSTALRFGSRGLSVTTPDDRAAARGAAATAGGATADRVHEVRVHLAAAATALGNSYCHDNNNSATLMVFEGDPAQGGTLVGMRRVRGLAGSGPAGRSVTLPWTPRTAGRRQLVAHLYGSTAASSAAPAQLTLDVDVAPATEPPATLRRLLEVQQVVWLPADLRAALVARIQEANAAAVASDQPAARAALTAVKTETEAAQGQTISGYSASRLTGLVDALLAQSAVAAFCLPASVAPAAAGTPGTPGPTATPAPGALPPCTPGPPSSAGVATPTASAAAGTVTPLPGAATRTPTPGGTPAQTTATATGTPRATSTPGSPAAGSPTAVAGSPTPQRTAAPTAPATVVPPPLVPPPAGTVP